MFKSGGIVATEIYKNSKIPVVTITTICFSLEKFKNSFSFHHNMYVIQFFYYLIAREQILQYV